MVYLPSITSSDASGKYHLPSSHIPTASEPSSPWPSGYSSGNTPVGLGFNPIHEGDEGDEEGKGVSVSPASPKTLPPSARVDVQDIWRGDADDWTRAHAALKLLKSDGRRLELWKGWLGDEGEQEEDITGMGRLSLERKRAVGEIVDREDKDRGKSIPSKWKGKGVAREVRWTEDQGRDTLRIDTLGTMEREDRVAARGAMSLFLTEEPLEVDSSLAPRIYMRAVLKEHASAQEILSLFIYPDSRAKFHDMLQRTKMLDGIPNDVSFTYSTDFREKLDV
ncbi:hypothetical protein FRC17_005982 [Serendipita sp. 399]|nr:hypothetical protein FRC17_005982 [Serendipita sp. 399]